MGSKRANRIPKRGSQKKSNLPLVNVNIRRWRLVPLGTWEVRVNIKVIAKWHKRGEMVDK